MTVGIYCIENLINGKKYIGKSVEVKHRLQVHKWMLTQAERPKNCNRYLYASVQKYGISNFHFGLIEDVGTKDKLRLSERELYWQDFYQVYDRSYGYNLLRESSGVITHSDETKQIISEKGKGRITSDKTKALISSRHKGRKNSEQTRLKISKSKIGIPRSEETKLKMSLALTGRKHTIEAKLAISEALRHRKLSKVNIHNMVEAQSRYSYVQYSKKDDVAIKVFPRVGDLLDAGFNPKLVSAACNGGRKSHKGFKWKKIPKTTC